METIAQACVVVLVLCSLERRWPPIVVGLLVGLGVWIRPDALLLLLPVGWVLGSGGRREIRHLLRRGACGRALGWRSCSCRTLAST